MHRNYPEPIWKLAQIGMVMKLLFTLVVLLLLLLLILLLLLLLVLVLVVLLVLGLLAPPPPFPSLSPAIQAYPETIRNSTASADQKCLQLLHDPSSKQVFRVI